MALGLKRILRALASALIAHPPIEPSSTTMRKIGPFIMHRASGRIGGAMIVMPYISVLARHPNRLEGRIPFITRTIENLSPFGYVLKNA